MRLPSPETIRRNIPNLDKIEELAPGGQKIVFRAVHQDYGPVVLKIILQPSERTQREIEAVTEHAFSNVPKLYEWGPFRWESVETIYLLEEYVAGETLRKRLLDNGKLPFEKCLHLLKTLLEFAVELENQRLVHRDIKPENIIVRSDWTYWILDFGIARHLGQTSITATAAHFGPHTAGYAAPEQFRNLKKQIDIRTDLFSIGVVVHEAITGTHPFAAGARDHLDILRRTETFTPTLSQMLTESQKQLGQFVDILMDRYPSRRPATARIARDWYFTILSSLQND